MTLSPATITTELLEHADGRPVAYIDASAIAVFAYQQPDGSYVVEICTREDITDRRLHLPLDGAQLLRANAATPVDAQAASVEGPSELHWP
jgi:hypothetical protein